jgi:hypothetical protein
VVCGYAAMLSPITSKVVGCTTNEQPSHVCDPRGVKFGATTQTQRATKARAKAKMQAIRTISIE